MNMSNRTLITAILALATLTCWAGKGKIIDQKKGSITFVVDENLTPTEASRKSLYDGERLAKSIVFEENIPTEVANIIATSFAKEKNIICPNKDAFFQSMLKAYANHQSVVLSPDMVWLLISQGFGRYVNANSEELRSQLVNHEGKMDLVIETNQNLLSSHADWPKLVGDFAAQIACHTKGDIAKTITADFSTTSPTERVASQITLMESVKSYFDFLAARIACGIPTITLKGTPDDWQRVLDKTKQLSEYGLGEWTKSLEPILEEFISAANGKPNQAFWQGMIKKVRPDKLNSGACLPLPTDMLDGWILKLFPNEAGFTSNSVFVTEEMPSERVRVSFKYHVIDPTDGTVLNATPMELWAGFIGAEEDTITNTLTPKIGWLVRTTQNDNDVMLENLKKENDGILGGIFLRVEEVPEVLSRLEHIKRLSLEFTGKVTLPDWFYHLTIDELTIQGYMSDVVKAKILKHFPNAQVR